TVVPTNQILSPIGKQLLFPGRPTDLALSPNGRLLAVANSRQVLLVDVAKQEIVDTAKISGASYLGILFSADGRELYVSTIPSSRKSTQHGVIARFSVEGDKLKARDAIALGQDAPNENVRTLSRDELYTFGTKHLPAGLALSRDGKLLYVALNLGNVL